MYSFSSIITVAGSGFDFTSTELPTEQPASVATATPSHARRIPPSSLIATRFVIAEARRLVVQVPAPADVQVLAMDPRKVAELKSFVQMCKEKPGVLHLPEMEFFRTWLHGLGATIPPLPKNSGCQGSCPCDAAPPPKTAPRPQAEPAPAPPSESEEE
ncbi:hypothetical protein AMELA_G00175810 [Ameiurus melas]|uniref:Hsp70-interacting protein N-terminal domain-containing protein n=1 Tax=Ameiurus melas TaxID=219545 RepID=A0A7J6AFM4_AMEME|nr:hypothetical protein AMELA_G00175810 [Ameiurus melas]